MKEMVCLVSMGKQWILIELTRKWTIFIHFDYHLYLLECNRLSTLVDLEENWRNSEKILNEGSLLCRGSSFLLYMVIFLIGAAMGPVFVHHKSALKNQCMNACAWLLLMSCELRDFRSRKSRITGTWKAKTPVRFKDVLVKELYNRWAFPTSTEIQEFHPNPGLSPRSPSRFCSWQPRMTPKRVLLVKIWYFDCTVHEAQLGFGTEMVIARHQVE
ncbi:hypothetical protein NC653_035019 [Populus alba x Populus x berolinensis]|uniref:Uncharacterized protein n=1 Tax=Populus alba x Populus x berolinensis TaxID=444605 RepID=A0AAD6LNX2_9ROSI|nr:hypothetical protein NC653_035019 [Populus alba x Populus x berolinensis]